jgi:hypothetical protein
LPTWEVPRLGSGNNARKKEYILLLRFLLLRFLLLRFLLLRFLLLRLLLSFSLTAQRGRVESLRLLQENTRKAAPVEMGDLQLLVIHASLCNEVRH